MKTRKRRITYLLVCLSEEAAEVSKECAKALRFGPRTRWRGENPESRLNTELNDLAEIVAQLKKLGIRLYHSPRLRARKRAALKIAMADSRRALVKP